MASSEALRDYYVDKIQEQGFVSIAFPLQGTDIDPLFGNFRELLDEVYEKRSQRGQDIIDSLAVEHPGRPGDSKGFVERRRVGQVSIYELGRGPGTDDKDQMHFTPLSSVKSYEYLRTRGGTPVVLRKLLDNCIELHEAVKKSVRPVADALGVGNYLFAPKGCEADDVHLLRILRYLGREATESAAQDLAELHFDRSKFTAAVWESKSGLVGTPGNNAYGQPSMMVEEFDAMAAKAMASPIKHRSGQIKFFAGAGYNRAPSGVREHSGNLPLLLHGVRNDHPGEERDAVVVFINQHCGVHGWSVPDVTETAFANIRNHLLDRQERRGGLVAS